MLIQRASLLDGSVVDIRFGETITAVAGRLAARPGEDVLDAALGTVLPGLHDHHVHLRSAAAALESVRAGPPAVRTAADLAAALRSAPPDADGWVRAYGYHESVAGPLDRDLLDGISAVMPTRVQHRSGALWVLNSAGLARLGMAAHPDGRFLRAEGFPAMPVRDPSLRRLSRMLAGYGVTGVTDATPGHDSADAAAFARASRDGELLQRLHCMGPAGAWPQDPDDGPRAGVTLGPAKIILDDADLDLDALRDAMRCNHSRKHGVAVHCVTDAQLTIAVAAFQDAGVHPDDRIEHVAVAPRDRLGDLAALGVTVVTQPNFVAERGDDYLASIPGCRHHELWPVASLRTGGIAAALSTDLPFGDADPWAAMRAAVHRRTACGAVLGAGERVTAAAAVTMFTGDASAPGRPRRVAAGQPADLCLLAAGPADALDALDAGLVRATIVAGEVVHLSPLR